MARLTSLASVLAALDFPEDRQRGRPDSATSAGAPPSPAGRASTGGASPDRPGFEIWQSARRQAEFYATYAEMLETDRRPRGPGDAWVREVYPAGQWVGPAALATSYRVAAQHAALVDAGWATRLAVRAGMAYVSAGLPFGLFLLTGLLDDETLEDGDVLRDVAGPFRVPDATDAVRHPVQQAYLLLAAASRPVLRAELSRTLIGAEQRLARHGLYPIGPQGVPLGEYVELSAAMSGDGAAGFSDSRSAVSDVAWRLAGLHRIQAATLRAARRNRYLWRNAASPVIDLEQVALSGVALRSRPWFAELSEAITTELDRDDELAQLPVWTMDAVESKLDQIAPSVTDIIREPERAWRTEDFHEPETETDPWTDEPVGGTPASRTDDYPRTGPDDYPQRRPDDYPRTDYPRTPPVVGPQSPPQLPPHAPPNGYPESTRGPDDEEGGDDEDPYFRNR